MKKIATRGGVVYLNPERVAMIASAKDQQGNPAIGLCLVFIVGNSAPIVLEASASDVASKLGLEDGDDPKQMRLGGVDPRLN